MVIPAHSIVTISIFPFLPVTEDVSTAGFAAVYPTLIYGVIRMLEIPKDTYTLEKAGKDAWIKVKLSENTAEK